MTDAITPQATEQIVSHQETIREQFTLQAKPFSESRAMTDHEAIDRLVRAAGATAHHKSLDVACGPGLVALQFASTVAHATGLDTTPAMIARARELAQERGVRNVEWLVGPAEALPFDDATFDIVTCRFAFHHMQDPLAALREMKRVTRPGGAVVVCDGVASDDRAKADAFNAFERVRDPSTVRFLTLRELRDLLPAAGLSIATEESYRVPAELERLMRSSFPAPADEQVVRQAIIDSIEHDTLGLAAQRINGKITFSYSAVILAAQK